MIQDSIRSVARGTLLGLLAVGLGCGQSQNRPVPAAKPETVEKVEKQTPPKEETKMEEQKPAAIKLTSSAFAEGEVIPKEHTGEGKDSSPALKWTGVPEGTKGLALICDDPDAPVGDWVHWVIYAIPAGTTELPEGVPTDKALASGAKQGTNDFKKIGYGGPMPPKGHGPHRYFFKLYALDSELALELGATKKGLLAAMEGHLLAQAQLMGKYERK